MIDTVIRSGKYCFRTRLIIGVGDIFRADNGHVGLITSIGKGDPPPHPTAEVVQRVRSAGKDAVVWIAKTKKRRKCSRRALRFQIALDVENEIDKVS